MYSTPELIPLTGQARQLLQLIWREFRAVDGWAAFERVATHALEKGIPRPDQLADSLFPHYIGFPRQGGPPFPETEVGLTIRGLAGTRRKGAMELATEGAEVIGTLAARRGRHRPARKAPQPAKVHSDELRSEPGLGPKSVRSLFWVLRNDFPTTSITGSMDAWTVTLGDALDQYRGVQDLESFLSADERRITSRIATERADPVLQYIRTGSQDANPSNPVSGKVTFEPHEMLEAATSAHLGSHPQVGGLAALNAVEARMRAMSGLADRATWEQLVARIFDAREHIIPPELEDQRQHLSKLFRSVGALMRNPVTHNRVTLDMNTGGEAIAVSSVLMRWLDLIDQPA